MTPGNRIRKARVACNLTQLALGLKCGIAEPTIRRYELGKLNPKPQTLQKIADALELPLSFFIATPPFKDLDFLNEFKNLILFKLEQKNLVFIGETNRQNFNNYDFWKLIANNIASIVQNDSNTVNIQYLNPKHNEIDEVKVTKAIAEFDFQEVIGPLIDSGYLINTYSILRNLNDLNENGIIAVEHSVIDISNNPKYQKEKVPDAANIQD